MNKQLYIIGFFHSLSEISAGVTYVDLTHVDKYRFNVFCGTYEECYKRLRAYVNQPPVPVKEGMTLYTDHGNFIFSINDFGYNYAMFMPLQQDKEWLDFSS